MKKIIDSRLYSTLFVICLFIVISLLIAGTAYAAPTEPVHVDNGIPVVYLNIDESEVTIDDMINSKDHSVSCSGTLSIDVPKDFHYCDFPDSACQSVAAFMARFGIPFLFAGSRAGAEYVAWSFLRQYAEGKRKELRAIEKALACRAPDSAA